MTEVAQLLGEVLQAVKSVEKDVARLSGEIENKKVADTQVTRDLANIREGMVRLESAHSSHLVSASLLHTAMESRIRALEDKTSSIPSEREHAAHKLSLRGELDELDSTTTELKKEVNKLKESKAWLLGAVAGINIAAMLIGKYLLRL